LEVFFADPDLRDLCSRDRDLRAKYGAVGAKRVGQRLQLLHQAETLDDVMEGPGGCHPLHGPYYQGCFSLRLHGAYRLVFRLMTDEEKKAKGVPDKTCALVIEIINYHHG
jgi:plasmid maintenance system killer protein